MAVLIKICFAFFFLIKLQRITINQIHFIFIVLGCQSLGGFFCYDLAHHTDYQSFRTVE